jgi:Cu-processing system permease protein
MSPVRSIMACGFRNLVRSRWLLGYFLLLLLSTDALFRFAGGGPRAAASLMNVVLIVVPLVSVVFGTLHFSSSREFMELLLAQPVGRNVLYGGLYLGLALPLATVFLVGVGLPALWHGEALAGALAVVLSTGVLLTLAFTSLAFLCGVRFEDRARGLGVALLVWFAAVVVWDGMILFVVAAFRDYPLERPLLLMTLANPVDLGRILMLLTLDAAALMGYTGAVFTRFFGTPLGIVAATCALLAWTVVPMLLGLRGFRTKDF